MPVTRRYEKLIRSYENSKDELKDDLRSLGWSQAKLAERLDVHPNTVSGWATGRSPIPGPVTAYLDLVIKVKKLL